MARYGPATSAGAAATDGGNGFPRWQVAMQRTYVRRDGQKWEYPMPLIESKYSHASWFEGFVRHAPLLHAPPARWI
jgi:hypothetical protein